MALVDSRAAFEQRCQEIDSSGDLFRGLDSQNIRTFSQLAFISGTPQQPMNQDDFSQLSAQVFGEGADLGVAANLRRLQFEAATLVVADLKSKVSSSSQPEATQLPAAEKAARKRDQRARLRGILAKGELEPSDALLDLAAGIVESNVVLWISPERCGKREDELLQLNKNNRQVLSVDADTIKLSSAKPEVKADVGTELRLQWALQRFDSEPKADTPEGVEAPFEKSEEDTLLQKLSQAVTKVALQAMAIDHTISKAAKQHIVIMDLSKEHGIAELRDFGDYRAVLCAAQNTQPLDKHLESMPKGALLLAEHGSFADDAVMEKIVLGVPRKPADFIQAAVQAGHPRSFAVTLNAVSEEAVVANRDWPVTDLIRARIDFLTYWMKRAQELEHAEKTLHLSMPEYLQQVLRGKRILLMGEMLERLGFEDKYLQQDVSEGFKLTGWLRETGCFPKKIRKPAMPAAAVMAMASSVNQRIVKQMAETSFSETDAKAWDETLAELDRGWIFRDDAPDLGKVLLAKRFGLAQKEKTRVIDDFSVGGLNSLAGLREKLAVQSIDEIAAHLAFVIDSKSSRSMGGVLGKTYDLTSAYKQYGVHPSDRDLARIAVKTPSGELAFFGTNALPFGAVGSVGGFLRISAALTFAGLKGPKLWWTSFYDDFTVFSDARALTSAAVSAEALFDLWGVKFAKDGKKAVDFSATVKSLGLLIGLDTILEGRIRIMHTPERKAELEEALKGILEAGELTCKHSEQLRGASDKAGSIGGVLVVYYIDNEAARTAFICGTGWGEAAAC
ncbi:unnamed protein product [Effrenium voratum]|uniref:Uncharacterized protein n=1 Tax=Effrenium voratum TaxID=2562239 RepID=A0AA36NNC7_9DINO|nr:unnamed protein product [Effrenium voratum]